jgi:hypothetical protein
MISSYESTNEIKYRKPKREREREQQANIKRNKNIEKKV